MATSESPYSSKSYSLSRELFTSFYDKLQDSELTSVHDLYIRYNPKHGDVTLATDDDTLSAQVTIYDWIVEEGASVEEREKVVIDTLKEVIAKLQEDGFFEDLSFQRPLSILYVRENSGDDDDDDNAPSGESAELIDDVQEKEIFFIDDDWVRLDDPLMQKLDVELDAFFKELMNDTE